MNIVLYKTDVCTQCRVAKAKLERKGIPFTEVKDLNVMRAAGIETIPTLEVDGERMTDIGTINKWINAQEAVNG